MKTLFLPTTLPYNGAQLSSTWVADQCPNAQDAIIAFIGPADVRGEHMVDLEDLANEDWIYSESMLHFIISHQGATLESTVLRQHLFIHQLIEQLRLAKPDIALQRAGDDIMDGEHKLSVSIATTSPTSGLIHTALNISSHNTPVPTQGLDDYGIDAITFGQAALEQYCNDHKTMQHAETKVRGVE